MKRVLLVIDVQNEYFTGMLPVTYPQGSLENIVKVMNSARNKNIPVIVIQHTAPQNDSIVFRKGSPGWELHPWVSAKPHDLLIEKNMPGCFTGTILEQWLRQRDIDTIVISGYMSQMCCDTTARQAVHSGFNVEFLSDATGTLQISNDAGTVKDEELHRAVLVTQAMRFSKVITSDEWIQRINT